MADLDLDAIAAAADHWDALAKGQTDMAEWIVANRPQLGDVSAYHARAETYARCASTLRLEAETGEPHCMRHEKPRARCLSAGMGMRLPGVTAARKL